MEVKKKYCESHRESMREFYNNNNESIRMNVKNCNKYYNEKNCWVHRVKNKLKKVMINESSKKIAP